MWNLGMKCVFVVLRYQRIQTWYVEIGDMYGDIGVWAIILLEILYAGGRNLWTQNEIYFSLKKQQQKKTDKKVKNTWYPIVQHCLTWQYSLPVLNSSCTGVISECHSNLGTKQGTGLTTNWNTSRQLLSSYKNIIVPLLCSNLEESSLGYTRL